MEYMEMRKRARNSLMVLAVCLTAWLPMLTAHSQTLEDTTTCTPPPLPWPQNVQAQLDSLMGDPLLTTTHLGLVVYDLTADSVIFSHDARQTLRPASTMKLLTAATALDCLGGSYRFRTGLYYDGEINGNVLQGDVWLVGGMDPLFDDTDMRAFAESFRRLGVDTIRGRIMADNTFKEENLLGEGWCWDDDNPQLTSLLINGKDEFVERFMDEVRRGEVYIDAPCVYGSMPKNARLLCSRAHPIDAVLFPMMKESNNLYAESLFFQIAAASGVRPATAAHARQAVKRFIAKTGFLGAAYRVADGSGLSLYNYVTPELMVRLLRYVYHHRDMHMYLLPSLPVAGQDGTLKKRMTGVATKGNVKAKTGTVTGVSSLAGYCMAYNRHQIAFCIINQGVLKGADGRAFQDKVCEALCRAYPVAMQIP